MTYASAHDEEVEYFVGAEVLVFCIEDWQLQGIDDTTNGVDDAACQQPQERRRGQGLKQRSEYQNTYPAHCNIDHGRKPFGTGDPAGFYQHADSGDAPHEGKQGVT